MSEGGVQIRRQRPFTQIDNEMIKDRRLSLKALGLGVRMLSWPPGKTYSIKYITKAVDVNKDTLRKLFQELIDCGYLVKTQTKAENGHFGVNSYLLDDVSSSPSPNFSATVKPAPEKPAPENPSPKNSVTKEILKGNKNTPVVPYNISKALEAYAAGDLDLLAALQGFAEKRAVNKNPINTTRSVTLLTNKLDKLSGGDRAIKIAMLDKAVDHNWASVYPLTERDREDLLREHNPRQDEEPVREEDQWIT